MGCKSGLAFFNRSAEPEFVAEVLGYAEAVLPGPAESNDVLRVDHLRQRFGTVVHAVRGFGQQTPHLAAREGPAAIEGRLSPDLTLAKGVAVAFVVVGSGGGGEKVRYVVSADFRAIELAFHEHRDAGLPAGGLELAHMRVGGTFERRRVKRRVDVRCQRLGAPHRFCREEAAGSQRDALELDRSRRSRVFLARS